MASAVSLKRTCKSRPGMATCASIGWLPGVLPSRAFADAWPIESVAGALGSTAASGGSSLKRKVTIAPGTG